MKTEKQRSSLYLDEEDMRHTLLDSKGKGLI
jgi:hypothetical protein